MWGSQGRKGQSYQVVSHHERPTFGRVICLKSVNYGELTMTNHGYKPPTSQPGINKALVDWGWFP